MRGAKPTPTVLKILRGNPGHRPILPEPQPAAGIPSCPDHLVGTARDEWDRITVELSKMNLLFHVDRSAIAAYCQCYGRWVTAEGKIKEVGIICEGQSGILKANPAVKIAHDAMLLMHRYLSEFGLSPASRTRIRVTEPQSKPTDPMEEFLARGRTG